MNDTTLVWRLMMHARRRSWLLLGAIAVAFCSFGMLDALRFSLNSGNDAASGQRLIVVHEAGLMQTLPMAHVDRIRQLAGVGAVSHATWQGSYFREQGNMFMSFAVDPGSWIDTHPDMGIDQRTRAAFVGDKRGMLLSAALAAKFGVRTGDSLPVHSILYAPAHGEAAWHYNVSGIFQPASDGGGRNYAVTHYSYLNDNRNFWRNTLGSIVVTPAPGVGAEELAQRIDEALASSDAPTTSRSDRAFHTEYFSQFGDVLTMLRGVIWVTFGSVLLMVTSGMALSARQRRRDLGVLRVIGYSNARIVRLVLAQCVLQVGMGASLGLGLAWVANRCLSAFMPSLLPDISLPGPVLLQGLGIAFGMALVAALVPAVAALRVKPVDALAQELS